MPISVKDGITNERWTLTYDELEVHLDVKKSGSPHSLFISNKKGFGKKNPWDVFFRIFNELVWFYNIEIRDLNGGCGEFCANVNFLPSEDSYAIQLNDFQQQVFEKDQHLALGFFREGISSGSSYYSFLCYSKILEIPFKDGKAKGIWIDEEINKLDILSRNRNVRLFGGETLGLWLKEEGRDALSHANIQSGKTIRDPNSYQDWEEIKWGNEIMLTLAEKVIIEKLMVRRPFLTRTRNGYTKRKAS